MQKLRYIVPTVLVALGLFALAQAQSTHTNARGQVFTVYKLSDGLGDSDSATANTLWTVPALLVSQDLDVTQDFAVNTNKFTVTAASGNTVVAGTLGVEGAATLASATVTGAATVGTTLGVTGVATLSDQLVAVPQTSSVEDGDAITLSGVVNNVTATEAATCTIADPGTAGRIAILVNAGSANNITVAKAANLALSDATVIVTPNGTLTLVAASATEWKELANSKDNDVD
jgi:hypothetical protein